MHWTVFIAFLWVFTLYRVMAAKARTKSHLFRDVRPGVDQEIARDEDNPLIRAATAAGDNQRRPLEHDTRSLPLIGAATASFF